MKASTTAFAAIRKDRMGEFVDIDTLRLTRESAYLAAAAHDVLRRFCKSRPVQRIARVKIEEI